MKRFIIHIFLWCLIPLPLMLATIGMFFVERAAYYKAMELPQGVHIVSTSDSILSLALDPAFFPGYANHSTAGTTIPVWQAKFDDLVRLNPKQINCLLIDLSPIKLLKKTMVQASATEHGSAFFWALHPELARTVPLTTSLPKAIFESEIPKRGRKYLQSLFRRKKPFIADMAGHYTPADECDIRNNPAKTRDTIQEIKAAISPVTDPATDERIRRYLSLISDAKAHGVRVVLLKIPVHPWLQAAYGPDLLSNYSAACNYIARKTDAPMFDYTGVPFPDELWQNQNHFNSRGAAFFTPLVAKDLAAVFVRQP